MVFGGHWRDATNGGKTCPKGEVVELGVASLENRAHTLPREDAPARVRDYRSCRGNRAVICRARIVLNRGHAGDRSLFLRRPPLWPRTSPSPGSPLGRRPSDITGIPVSGPRHCGARLFRRVLLGPSGGSWYGPPVIRRTSGPA